MPSEIDEYGIPQRGSALQIAYFVNCEPDRLEQAIRKELALPASLSWVSPLAEDDFAEYWDARFVERLGRPDTAERLSAWWPRGGAHWDALAQVGGPDGSLLLEAKANVPEIANGARCAAGDTGTPQGLRNRAQIEEALVQTRRALGVAEAHAEAWLDTHCYQYANRLAHLHFLQQTGRQAWLVNLYFTDDESHIATTRQQFDAQRAADAEAMGLSDAGITGSAAVFLRAEKDAYARLRAFVEQPSRTD
jgi:hypothetical protein